MQTLALSLAVLAALLCLGAALWGMVKGRMARTKALLMLAVGVVLLANAWLWATMPRLDGQLPQAEQAAAQP